MDEPTAALGVAETAKVEQIIRGLRARNLAILMISHNLDQVFRIADRVCVLRRGAQVGWRKIAETTGVLQETVKSRLRYARASLRKALADERSAHV